jgi:hypothetical protein
MSVLILCQLLNEIILIIGVLCYVLCIVTQCFYGVNTVMYGIMWFLVVEALYSLSMYYYLPNITDIMQCSN